MTRNWANHFMTGLMSIYIPIESEVLEPEFPFRLRKQH
jgi:hypothetical protein